MRIEGLIYEAVSLNATVELLGQTEVTSRGKETVEDWCKVARNRPTSLSLKAFNNLSNPIVASYIVDNFCYVIL